MDFSFLIVAFCLIGLVQMQIEGSVRANLLAAITSARRWRGRPVHKDTVDHWRRLLEYAKHASRHHPGEVLGDVVAELEAELVQAKAN